MTDSNGLTHVTGYGDMKLTTADQLEADARRQLDKHRQERDANLAEIAELEQLIAERRRRIRFHDGYVTQYQKALGETAAPGGAKGRSRRSQGHTEAIAEK